MNIVEALALLDPLDDDVWTDDGFPTVESVSALVGDELTRQDITDADPTFNREAALEAAAEQSPEETPDEETPDEEPYLNPDEELAQTIKQLDDEINEIVEERDEVQKGLDAKIQQRNMLEQQRQLRNDAKSDTQARLDFIAAQQKMRAERAERSKQILKGLDVNSLNVKSPIDQAMSRNTQRGGQRPNRQMTPQDES